MQFGKAASRVATPTLVTRNTVKNILKRNGYDTGPKRGNGTWDEFLKRHAKNMWQCDFFSKKIVSKTGLRDIFVLVFLDVDRRRVFITQATYKPEKDGMMKQVEAFIKHTKEQQLPGKILMLDNECKYSQPFINVIEAAKIKTQHTAFHSPSTVAFVERFVQSIKQEALDRFVVFGRQHMAVICSEYVAHYLSERPHQGLGNELIQMPPATKRLNSDATGKTILLCDIRCQERLGGLLKSYSRKAA